MNAIYELVGEILEVTQYIEWNLALIVCDSLVGDESVNVDQLFDEMQAMTMGREIALIKKVEVFHENNLQEIEYILDKRNYLAHQFFKKNDCVKHYNNYGFVKNKINELRNILLRFQRFNKKIFKIIKK